MLPLQYPYTARTLVTLCLCAHVLPQKESEAVTCAKAACVYFQQKIYDNRF
uniref:Uncharacterized protein n=1 Tax=Anguilla anguilla TaxID=7936 RepID=A0A0E9WFM2_ANGAN